MFVVHKSASSLYALYALSFNGDIARLQRSNARICLGMTSTSRCIESYRQGTSLYYK